MGISRGCWATDSNLPGSNSRHATWMSELSATDFLATVPLFDGRDEAGRAELARMLRRLAGRADRASST